MPIASKCLKKGMPFVAVLSICHNEAIVQLQTIKWFLVLASVLTLGVAGTLAIALYAHSSLSGRAIIWVGSAVSPTNRSIVLRAAGTWNEGQSKQKYFFKKYFFMDDSYLVCDMKMLNTNMNVAGNPASL